MYPTILESLLSGYRITETHFLVTGFKFGFKIPFQGSQSSYIADNLPSVRGLENILLEHVANELSCKRIAGPFLDPPLPNFRSSPLGLVPKKSSPGEYRMIHHLSFPDDLSVNDGIAQSHRTVKYQSIYDAIALIQHFGKGSLMAKTDIAHAYKIIPIHPSNYNLLGFRVHNEYYYDKTLPFGLSYSCQLFERFSSALQWILEHKFQVQGCAHILDDFFFIGPPNSPACENALLSFYSLSRQISFPIKQEKTVYPTTILTFLGLELDSERMEVRLPDDKLLKLKLEVQSFLSRSKATLKELQSLIGSLNFACAVVAPGRPYLRRIIDLTVGLKKSWHRRSLNISAKADLEAWSIFLHHFNGRALILPQLVESSTALNLFTDASDLGIGGVFGTRWFYFALPHHFKAFSIAVREFLAIVVAVDIWHSLLSNRCIQFFSDNTAVVFVVNKLSSADKLMMNLMRRLMITVLKYNISFTASHISGIHNKAADLLSRLQVTEFQRKFPHMEPYPTPIPEGIVTL